MKSCWLQDYLVLLPLYDCAPQRSLDLSQKEWGRSAEINWPGEGVLALLSVLVYFDAPEELEVASGVKM